MCSEVAELRHGVLTVFHGSYSQYKGVRVGKDVVEEAEVYKVVSGFTEWALQEEILGGRQGPGGALGKGTFPMGLDNGKLRRIPGKERKIINNRPGAVL